MRIEHKTLDARFKALDSGADGLGSFSAYVATFGVIDRANEKIEPGAFKNLDEFIRDGFIAYGHSTDALPIATVTSAAEDRTGLLVTGDFHGTPAAQQARSTMAERLSRGKSVQMSIGYRVLKDARATDPQGRGYRSLKEIELFEASWVAIAANASAGALAVKGHPGPGGRVPPERLERLILEWQYTELKIQEQELRIKKMDLDSRSRGLSSRPR